MTYANMVFAGNSMTMVRKYRPGRGTIIIVIVIVVVIVIVIIIIVIVIAIVIVIVIVLIITVIIMFARYYTICWMLYSICYMHTLYAMCCPLHTIYYTIH